MEIMKASEQWAMRPEDERFWTVADMLAAALNMKDHAYQRRVDMANVRIERDGAKLLVRNNQTGNSATLTNWPMRQLCAKIGAPASYLQELPIDKTEELLNFGVDKLVASDADRQAKLLVHENGGYYVRAFTGPDYARIWNADVIERLQDLQSQGWAIPPCRPSNVSASNTRIATAADAALSLTVKEGDVIGPGGLYLGNEDMFAFMVDPTREIKDGSEGGL